MLSDQSFTFAIRIVKCSKYLQSDKKEFVLSKQLLRSGTAIGALIREGEFAQSKPDFISKMSIALKEANETVYWLDLLFNTEYLDEKIYKSLKDECKELLSMLVATVKTTKEKLKTNSEK